MAGLLAPTPPIFNGECNGIIVLVCSVGSIWLCLIDMSCKGMLERENRQRSPEEEDDNRLLRCKNSFMLNHAGTWAVSLLGHSSPAQPWPGLLLVLVPLMKQRSTLASALQVGQDLV